MSREKQIEEMAKAIYQSGMVDNYTRCQIVAGELYDADYRKVDDIFEDIFEGRLEVVNKISGDKLKKASEVAEEIFAAFRAEMRSEIARNEELIAEDEDDFYEGRNDAYRTAINCLAELKKKYTEEGK